MNINRLIGALICFLLMSLSVNAQSPQDLQNAQQVQQDLSNRNIPEEEIEKRLLERGIDVNSIDPADAAQLAEVEAAIQDIIAEIEAERANSGGQKAATPAEETAAGEVKAGTKVDQQVEAIKDLEEEKIAEQIEEAKQDLPPTTIYGQEVFREYEAISRTAVKPPSNYLIGSGDEIGVSIFGASEASFSFEVNEEGYIQPATLGRIYLKGLTFGQAKELLRKRFSRGYSFNKGQFAVNINYSRQIIVNIVGNVGKPGTYPISAAFSAINALARAGGPSNIGSLRKIRIIGEDGARNLDIYKFLQNPDSENVVFLQNNDYIHVPTYDKHVSISGAIKRPMTYELINGENLGKLVEYAGGFTSNAYKSGIQITRIVDDEEKIIDLDYAQLLKSGRDFELLNGDKISIKQLNAPVENVVKISGAVRYEGDYELQGNMRASDLLKRSEPLKEAYLSIAFLKRVNYDGTSNYIRLNLEEILKNPSSDKNIVLQSKDALKVFTQSSRTIEDNYSFSVQGAVMQPNTFEYSADRSIKIEDAIQLAGGLRQDAKKEFAYIVRRDPVTSEPEYIRFDIGAILENPELSSNIVLEPGDVIKIASTRNFLDEAYVEVIGAVRNPGEFEWDESLTLRDVLTLSNGVQLSAAKNRIEVFRLVLKNNKPTETIAATVEIDENLNILSGDGNFKLEPYDIIAVRYIPGFDKQEMVTISGEVAFNGVYPILAENERLTSLIERAGGLTNEAFPPGATLLRSEGGIGYIVIMLDEVLKNPKSPFNVVLKQGDILNIPKAKELVTIQGATEVSELYLQEVVADSKVTVPYLKNKSAKNYVDEYAAGFSERANRNKVTVQYPSGKLKGTKNFGLFRIYPSIEPGSVINVPVKSDKKEKEREEKEPTDWNKVLKDAIAQATTILTLVILMQNINR